MNELLASIGIVLFMIGTVGWLLSLEKRIKNLEGIE